MDVIVAVGSVLLPLALGVRPWFLLLCWLPCVWGFTFLWAYVGVHIVPPALESSPIYRTPKDPKSILDLRE